MQRMTAIVVGAGSSRCSAIHVIPAIAVCPVRPKSGHSARRL
jgi:hypothetical protein